MSILLVFAFVLFVIAAFPYSEPYEIHRYKLVAAGLACWVGSILFKL
jgi:hypothetical protein